jgi:hypothetical protein
MFHQEYHVQQYGDGSEGYTFHTEFNDEDAETLLFGTCPEVVRVTRALHAKEVHNRILHVADRTNHYVYGVTAVEDLVTHAYSLARLPRSGFCMCPEEWFGIEINSASMM